VRRRQIMAVWFGGGGLTGSGYFDAGKLWRSGLVGAN